MTGEMVGELMNGELQNMWKQAIVDYFKIVE
jgi:hypothetical protein